MVRCLIADDEYPARKLIGQHLTNLDGFEVVAAVDNGTAAFNFLQQHPVDLVFLDINMPGISGLELLQSLSQKPQIIITTAYREHAAQAYDLDVLDYLSKPITTERFIKAIAKYNQIATAKQVEAPPTETHHFFKSGREQLKINLNDILFIEGLSDYARVHTLAQSYVVAEKLTYLEKTLPSDKFIRIHKSFIIAFDKISSYSSVQVNLNGKTLPIGRLYKNSFMNNSKLKKEIKH